MAAHSLNGSARAGARAMGFTYLGVLIVLAIMSTSLALVGDVWDISRQREREVELLHTGHAYRKAIERYYLSGPRQYPRSLDDLIKDPRRPDIVRHLRAHYPDPITNSAAWGLVKAPDGGIMGVHSLSEKTPLKQAGFRVRDAAFENAKTYAEWKFVYAPALASGVKPVPKPPAAR